VIAGKRGASAPVEFGRSAQPKSGRLLRSGNNRYRMLNTLQMWPDIQTTMSATGRTIAIPESAKPPSAGSGHDDAIAIGATELRGRLASHHLRRHRRIRSPNGVRSISLVFGGRIRAMMLPVATERHADLPMRILYRALANRMRDQIKLRTDGSIPFKTKCLGL
jgi:hypothetical protein